MSDGWAGRAAAPTLLRCHNRNGCGTTDRFGRPLGTLRVSVTDRCNLRCAYCMPETEYVWLPRADLLTFEEIDRLVAIFVSLGAERVRLTGGEPLLRRDLAGLVGRLASRTGLKERALTTNGVHLAAQAEALRAAGLDGSPSASTRWTPTDSCACHARGTSTRSLPALRPPRRRSARSSSIPSSSAARTTTSCRRSSSTPGASARKSASSNTWTSAARRTGPPPAWCPAPRSWPGSSARSAGSRRLDSRATRRPRATRCRTARRSASSRRPPSRSAAIAIGPG